MEYHQVLEIIENEVKADPKFSSDQLFHEYSLLTEDLGYDSVGLLGLLVKLELKAGVDLPEESFSFAGIRTVQDLANVLLGGQDGGLEENPSDNVTVHCLVSCFCYSLKELEVDFRPLYFGLWEAPFHYADGKFYYHMAGDQHDAYVKNFENLYGARVDVWYDFDQTKQANLIAFQEKLHSGGADQVLISMFDLSMISCRDNKFEQAEFPHYAMFEATDNEGCIRMLDPDYRWAGDVPTREVLASMQGDSIAGGYAYSKSTLDLVEDGALQAHLEQVLSDTENRLTAAVRGCLEDHSGESARYPSSHLIEAMSEVPVLAIRKYAYEHAFAYYMLSGHLAEERFDEICESIAELAEGYKVVQYHAAKFSQTNSPSVLAEAFSKLENLDRIESELKSQLVELQQAQLVPA